MATITKKECNKFMTALGKYCRQIVLDEAEKAGGKKFRNEIIKYGFPIYKLLYPPQE